MNNNLNDIKPLLNVDFKYLKLLNLELNKLSDDMIDIIKDLKFPELKEFKLIILLIMIFSKQYKVLKIKKF